MMKIERRKTKDELNWFLERSERPFRLRTHALRSRRTGLCEYKNRWEVKKNLEMLTGWRDKEIMQVWQTTKNGFGLIWNEKRLNSRTYIRMLGHKKKRFKSSSLISSQDHL